MWLQAGLVGCVSALLLFYAVAIVLRTPEQLRSAGLAPWARKPADDGRRDNVMGAASLSFGLIAVVVFLIRLFFAQSSMLARYGAAGGGHGETIRALGSAMSPFISTLAICVPAAGLASSLVALVLPGRRQGFALAGLNLNLWLLILAYFIILRAW
jgi:hypothetical protein